MRAKDLNIWPIGNIETAIVQSGTTSNVDTVLVDGRLIKRHGRLLAYDVNRIVRGAQRSSARIRIRRGDIEVLGGLRGGAAGRMEPLSVASAGRFETCTPPRNSAKKQKVHQGAPGKAARITVARSFPALTGGECRAS